MKLPLDSFPEPALHVLSTLKVYYNLWYRISPCTLIIFLQIVFKDEFKIILSNFSNLTSLLARKRNRKSGRVFFWGVCILFNTLHPTKLPSLLFGCLFFKALPIHSTEDHTEDSYVPYPGFLSALFVARLLLHCFPAEESHIWVCPDSPALFSCMCPSWTAQGVLRGYHTAFSLWNPSWIQLSLHRSGSTCHPSSLSFLSDPRHCLQTWAFSFIFPDTKDLDSFKAGTGLSSVGWYPSLGLPSVPSQPQLSHKSLEANAMHQQGVGPSTTGHVDLGPFCLW